MLERDSVVQCSFTFVIEQLVCASNSDNCLMRLALSLSPPVTLKASNLSCGSSGQRTNNPNPFNISNNKIKYVLEFLQVINSY